MQIGPNSAESPVEILGYAVALSEVTMKALLSVP